MPLPIGPVLGILADNLKKRGSVLPLSKHAASGWTKSLNIPRGGETILFTGLMYQLIPSIDAMASQMAMFENSFITNFFGDEFTRGTSNIEVYFHFPPGVQTEEPRYHKTKFSFAGVNKEGIIYYYWKIPTGDIALGYRFGASFPKKYLAEGVVKKVTIFTRIGMFLSNIFRNIVPQPLIVPCIFPYGIIAFFILVGIFSGRRRRMQYFKPKVSAKGVGIKRGLSAVEAAILLERPFDKVFAMIVFGLLKKGVIALENKKPLKMRKIDVGKEQIDTLYAYERKFIDALDKGGKPRKSHLKKAGIALVKSVSGKMKNFNLRQTRNYYESIVDTAWKHVKAADLENSIEWTMLDKRFDKRLEGEFPTDVPINEPTWWRPYYRGYYGRPYTATTAGGGVPGSVGKATLSPKQFVNSVAGGFESVSHNVVSSVESFTGGITDVTNPAPKSSGGGSSGGGGGCACACACAGCACACAGGGR